MADGLLSDVLDGVVIVVVVVVGGGREGVVARGAARDVGGWVEAGRWWIEVGYLRGIDVDGLFSDELDRLVVRAVVVGHKVDDLNWLDRLLLILRLQLRGSRVVGHKVDNLNRLDRLERQLRLLLILRHQPRGSRVVVIGCILQPEVCRSSAFLSLDGGGLVAHSCPEVLLLRGVEFQERLALHVEAFLQLDFLADLRVY